MSIRYWFTAIAVGLALTVVALAQDTAQPALKGEPIPKPRQEQSASTGQDSAQSQDGVSSDIAPFLQGIEAAIRDLIAEEDKIERERQQDREIRDLKAQEEMALWAERMTWVTFAGIVLTFAGLVLIGFTLHHTRRAADYAKSMVSEAEKTTAAAVDAAKAASEANIIMRDEQRPWVAISVPLIAVTLNKGALVVEVQVQIENIGKSVAKNAAVEIALIDIDRGQQPVDAMRNVVNNVDRYFGVEHYGHTLLPNGRAEEGRILTSEPEDPPYKDINLNHLNVAVCCGYRFGNENIGRTAVLYDLTPIERKEDFVARPIDRFKWMYLMRGVASFYGSKVE